MPPGSDMILWCKRPLQSNDWLVTFSLLKAGTLEPLQNKSLRLSQADFSLKSLRDQDSGIYTCIYYETTGPPCKSEPSDALEIWVTDSLPKPSLSAWPNAVVASRGNVTLLCRGPSRGVGFALYKEGDETPVAISEPTQDGAEFSLNHVSLNQTGKYRCCYHLEPKLHVLALPSDPLELLIQGQQHESSRKEIKVIFITTLSCAAILFLLLLLTLVHHCHRVSSHGEISRRLPRCLCYPWVICFSSKPGAPQEETIYTQVAKQRPSRTPVPEAEDPERLTYAQLNLAVLNEHQTASKKVSPTLHVYATLSGD
ncbi:T-cell-interacting, activating receptor on myeloid cells protein 1-like [Monodelphis domestica]|uniref:T-cell-interacting, activating receptor on myeloid cells protein 1-like n=1 Tax=Monodelphis domestica TaxID=13616 RepID=UPI0024E21AAF|nr:T-cell-interacting, activating receptor on myeloid cells protein 1-like [Monodelphis domestica]